MVENDFPKVDGDVFFASEANILASIKQIYTASGFDSTIATIGTDEQDHELTAITSSVIGIADYLIIEATVFSDIRTNQATAVFSTALKFQVKETGQAYGDVMTYRNIDKSSISTSATVEADNFTTIKWVHILTAGEKSNGVQVKVFGKSVGAVAANGTASLVNVQTVLTLSK